MDIQQKTTWLHQIVQSNAQFTARIDTHYHPLKRESCPYAIITCMDPRVNLEAVGIPPFTHEGMVGSQVRIIRTLGAMSDHRSLVVGIHLAGFKEIALMMHTDCGGHLAYTHIEKLIENMRTNLSDTQFYEFTRMIGEPFTEKLIDWLKAFEDPGEAVKQEILRLKSQPFLPHSLVIHGLIYDLSTGAIEVVINGYEQ
jgi:carbonic anhydrase